MYGLSITTSLNIETQTLSLWNNDILLCVPKKQVVIE